MKSAYTREEPLRIPLCAQDHRDPHNRDPRCPLHGCRLGTIVCDKTQGLTPAMEVD